MPSERDSGATPQKRVRTTGRTTGRRSGETLTAEEAATAKVAFLDAYAQHGNVGTACETARVHRATVYRWMEHDEPFALLYHQAKEEYNDLIREEIDRRARRGWSETVYQLAKRAGAVRKYDTALLIFQAKARMPEYRDKVQLEHSGRMDVQHGLPDNPELAALARQLIMGVSGGARDPSGSGVPGE